MQRISTVSVAGAVLALAAMGSVARAAVVAGETIGIDFGTNPADNNFNDASTAPPDALATIKDLSGATVAGVGFSVTGNGTGNFSNNDGGIGTVTGLPAPFDQSNYSDFTGTYGATAPATATLTLTFTGLANNLTYNLVGVSAFKGGDYTQSWQAGAGSFTIQSQQNNPSGSLTGLVTDGSGNLVISVVNVSGGNAFANALTLTAVPEPASLSLLSLGTLGLLARRRR